MKINPKLIFFQNYLKLWFFHDFFGLWLNSPYWFSGGNRFQNSLDRFVWHFKIVESFWYFISVWWLKLGLVYIVLIICFWVAWWPLFCAWFYFRTRFDPLGSCHFLKWKQSKQPDNTWKSFIILSIFCMLRVSVRRPFANAFLKLSLSSS